MIIDLNFKIFILISFNLSVWVLVCLYVRVPLVLKQGQKRAMDILELRL